MSTIATDILTGLSFLGSLASILGIYLTFRQVKSVRKIAEETRKEINKTDAISEIVKCNSLIKEAIPLLKQDNFEIALVKMRDVKDKIIELGIVAELLELGDFESSFKDTIKRHTEIISHDINAIDDNYKTPHLLNKRIICKSMDELSSFMVETRTRIANKISH